MAWTRTWTYETGTNRLTEMAVNGGPPAPVTHDALGQMTALPNLQALVWDAGGRLRRTQRLAGATADRTRYVYDASGQRVRKVSETWDSLAEPASKGETLHLSDGGPGSGVSGRVALVETRTTEGGTAVSTPTPLLRLQFDNHLGSASLETTADGQLLSYEEYHPYGTVAYSAGTATLDANPKRYRYSGKERDTESGLYYYGARYLAPWLGRWISPDPSGFVDGVNVYGFVRGRPTTSRDPNGRNETDANDPNAPSEGHGYGYGQILTTTAPPIPVEFIEMEPLIITPEITPEEIYANAGDVADILNTPAEFVRDGIWGAWFGSRHESSSWGDFVGQELGSSSPPGQARDLWYLAEDCRSGEMSAPECSFEVVVTMSPIPFDRVAARPIRAIAEWGGIFRRRGDVTVPVPNPHRVGNFDRPSTPQPRGLQRRAIDGN